MKWVLKRMKAYRCGYRRQQASRRRDYLPYRQWQEGCSIIEGDRGGAGEWVMKRILHDSNVLSIPDLNSSGSARSGLGYSNRKEGVKI